MDFNLDRKKFLEIKLESFSMYKTAKYYVTVTLDNYNKS